MPSITDGGKLCSVGMIWDSPLGEIEVGLLILFLICIVILLYLKSAADKLKMV